MARTASHCPITRLFLLAATVMPVIFFFTQIAAAPFYPGYRFSQQSVSMLGTHFYRPPGFFKMSGSGRCVAVIPFPAGLNEVRNVGLPGLDIRIRILRNLIRSPFEMK